MGSSFVFWPCFAGLLFLIIGLISFRKEIAAATGLDKLVALAGIFVAAPMAVFAAEHLAGPRILMQLVPAWMPARLFWAFFVGFALLAAALSLTFKRYVRWSTLLLAIMLFLFVASIHIPNVIALPKEKIFWTVMLRDFAFAAGILAFAAFLSQQQILTTIGRVCFAIPVIFFGVEYFLHPLTAPGIPLAKLTPAWVPFPPLWGYLTGAILLISGIMLLLNKESRKAATAIGLTMSVITLVLYLPLLFMATGIPQTVEGLNYVADTLLFAGVALLVASASSRDHSPAVAPH
ncbi:MAG TPA: DoxX family membrane protein [Edaphobacter sp.]|nr:DoxX family membrane protein [Edaphobacter sp.]